MPLASGRGDEGDGEWAYGRLEVRRLFEEAVGSTPEKAGSAETPVEGDNARHSDHPVKRIARKRRQRINALRMTGLL